MKREPVPLNVARHVVFIAAIAWALASGGVIVVAALVCLAIRLYL